MGAVAGMTDVLTGREVLGQYGPATPKSTMRNALLQGASRAADAEASRRAREAARETDHITLAAGSGFIVSLTAAFKPRETGP